MNEMAIYLKNLDYLIIFDIIIAVAVMSLAIAFFRHKRSMRVFFILAGLTVLYTAVAVINAFSENNALYLGLLILRYTFVFAMICVAIVYQSDIKSYAQRVANPNRDLFFEGFGSDDELQQSANEIITAVQNMAKQDIGALLIITPSTVDGHILDSGTLLNASLSSQLLESIFNTKAPLHDGAVVIKGNKIVSAGCFLPLTQDVTLPKELGTRHRAAIGITEESNVLAIVVSEETGIISLAKHGKIQRYINIEKLKDEIKLVFGISQSAVDGKRVDENKKLQKKK